MARLTSLGTRSAASIADQFAAAAIGLMVAVFIGRTIGPEALGVYAIASVIVLIVRLLQNGALLEALSVFGPRRPAAERGEYLGSLLVFELAWVGGITLLAALGAVVWFTADSLNDAAFFAVLACLLFSNLITFQYLIRRLFYVDQRPFQALLQSSMFLVLVVAGLALLAFSGSLSVAWVYLTLTACSTIVCLVQARRWLKGLEWPKPETLRRYLREHWRYGRWVIATIPFAVFTSQGYFFLTGFLLSAAETGHLKAAETLIAIFGQVGIGLGFLMIPMTARHIDTMTVGEQRRRAGFLLLSMMTLAGLYTGLLMVFGEDILVLLFGSKIMPAIEILPVIALAPLCQAFAVPAAIIVTARKRPDLRLLSRAVATLGTFTLGIALIQAHGLWGAAAGLTCSLGLFAISLWACVFWLWRQ